MKRPDLILFAKHPQPGAVKTRVAATLGDARAAELAAWLLRATVALATEFWPGEVWLYGAPDAGHPLFTELEREFHIHLSVQRGADLGERMRVALAEGITRSGAAAVMGCDVPHCPGQVIEHAYDRLAKGHNLIGPSLDGGYYFLGLSAPADALFRDMDWGGPKVRAETLARARDAGIELEPLPVLRDIDSYDDLTAVARDYPPLREFLAGARPVAIPIRPRRPGE